LDLAALARETVQMVKASISKKVTVDLHLAEDLPPVEGDAAQIRQVVMNLLLNASEAIGQEVGTISMTIRKGEGLERREGSGASGDWVLLEVADTGVGMDEATRARIFEPFFTTKFAGRGLGLAAVQGIVRSHCGEVSVTSTPGEGTTFRVIFPAFTSTSAKREESPPVPVVRQFRGRVLLVDDEEEIREVGQGMLENLGFDVTTAGDGLGALKLLGSGERFDAVLLDLTMPRLDGVETLNRIRADHPGLPVVLVSGYDERELSRRVSVVGLAGFLHKPFSLDSLSKTMASALNQRG
jgi:CheY-like chemotaxis protein